MVPHCSGALLRESLKGKQLPDSMLWESNKELASFSTLCLAKNAQEPCASNHKVEGTPPVSQLSDFQGANDKHI
jgi:hypothetical protein